jgi:branched-chain amino acid transport system ATP-binding protein
MTAGAALEVEDLWVRYGGKQAMAGVTLRVDAGHAVAVLGPNGAGKSTLGRALSGLVPVASGHVRLGDDEITGWPPYRVRQAGLAYIPEGRGIFPGLSVIDNLRMTARLVPGRAAREEVINRATALFPVLGERREQRAGSLSGGEQQMLALARALAVQPRLVIADEMSLGLAPLIVDQVFETLEGARAGGVTLVLIEQFVHRALAFADECVILARGSVAWSGASKDAGEAVLERYLGEAAVVQDAAPSS